MKKYAVYIPTKGWFATEVIAKDEEEAIELARDKWSETDFRNLFDPEECGKVITEPNEDEDVYNHDDCKG